MEYDFWLLNFLLFKPILIFIWWALVVAITVYKEWDGGLMFLFLLVGTFFFYLGPIGYPEF